MLTFLITVILIIALWPLVKAYALVLLIAAVVYYLVTRGNRNL